MPTTRKKLETAEAAYQKSAARAEAHRLTRNALVRDALAEGWTHQAVADALGTSRGRISQLASPRKATA
jgi:hypothetical protein